jgi:hypothetical protein
MKKSRSTFGPWSTALHSDVGEHLNTFWRRRLVSLPAVAASPQRLSYQIVSALVLVAVFVAAVPTLHFAAAVAKEDAPAEKAPPVGGPFADVPFPTKHAASIKSPAAREANRKKLYKRIDEVCEQVTTDLLGQLDEKKRLVFIPADTESQALRELRHLYKSREGQNWLRMWHQEGGASVQAWTYGDKSIADFLGDFIGLKLHRIEGDTEILSLDLLGDWVFQRDPRLHHSADPREVAVLEDTLRKHLGLDINLELKTVPRSVYVARGNYRFQAIAGPNDKPSELPEEAAEQADGTFQIPVRRTTTAGSVAHSFEQLLDQVSEILLVPIVDETTTGPEKSNFFTDFNGKQLGELTERLDEATEKKVVDDFSKQTGLTLTKEMRDVQILTVTVR